jgi:Cft2 family RNA processing exonuclease
MPQLLTFTDRGIYCRAGDFYIDPWGPVGNAVITHAHSDHARWGSRHYLAHKDSEPILRLRLGQDISLQTLQYREQININGVSVTLYPAGHIIGSAQVRVEYKGEVWVASGDYKTENDGIPAIVLLLSLLLGCLSTGGKNKRRYLMTSINGGKKIRLPAKRVSFSGIAWARLSVSSHI